jgi:uncharacterized SAM-binding protein YcdF (DUF218 family)
MFRLLKLMLMIALAAGTLYFAHGPLLTKAVTMIIRQDEMKPADAIVVLAGEETERVEYGARLFKNGWARKDMIIMSGGPLVWKYSWAGLMKDHAESLDVPAGNILIQDKSRSTEEDAIYTKELMKKNHIASIILVTSPYHSRRASIIFERVLGKDIGIISAPVENSWFEISDWWKRRRERATVLNEVSKYIWLWIFGVQETA